MGAVTEGNWIDDSGKTLVKNLAVPQALLVRGEGSHVWDSENKQYLDFLGGIAVNCLGHAHPVFVEAVLEQAQVLSHVSNYFVTEPQLELAKRLLRLSGAGENGRVFFANSGTEANEAALKLARLFGNPKGKKRILALEGAFHGRTMGALALTSKEKYRDPFLPLPGKVEHIGRTLEDLKNAIDDEVAALFIEPIQGEAGVVELPHGYLELARELTEKHDSLLIFDEVQTGAARTGKWFGYQHSEVVPDAITMAKGMGAGFPIGALITFNKTSDLFYPGSHGTTFGGNPLAAHVSNRVLETLEQESILENVVLRGEQLKKEILAIESPLISEIRGKGLLLGIILNKPLAAEVSQKAFENGLIINAPAPNVIRIAPALIIDGADIEEFIALFQQSLREVLTQN